MKRFLTALLLAACALGPQAARAQLTVVASPANPTSGAPGQMLSFFYTLTNDTGTAGSPSGTPVYLNSDDSQFTLIPSGGDARIVGDPGITDASVVLDDDPFFDSGPTGGGDPFDAGNLDPLSAAGVTTLYHPFDITLGLQAVSGDYQGTFVLLGGSDPDAGDSLGTLNFAFTVAAAPEPSPAVCLALGAGGLLSLFLARRARRVA